MSREIKFRAILKRESVFRDVVGIIFNDLTVLVSISGSLEWHLWKVLVQFTGLEDKNGIEIYSDDIVKAWTKDGATLIGKVVIESDETVIETTDHQWPVASFTVLDRLEVIGNSHENPELLKEDDDV